MAIRYIDAPLAIARATFLDGMIVGKPIGEIVSTIINDGIAFGEETFRDGDTLGFGVKEDDIAVLKRHVLETTFTSLFDGNLKDAIHNAVLSAVAFGFQQKANSAKYASIEAARDAVLIEAEANDGTVSDDTMAAFFDEANALMATDNVTIQVRAIKYLRDILLDPENTGVTLKYRIKFNTRAPYFKSFTEKYATLLIA